MERVAVDEDLLAASDKPVVVVVGMGLALIPRDELVRPGRAVHSVVALHGGPVRDAVSAGEDDMLPLGGPDGDGLIRVATLVDGDSLAVDAAVDQHGVAGLELRDGLADCPHLAVGGYAGERLLGHVHKSGSCMRGCG